MASQNTRASLLLRLRDPRDARAWEEFIDVYAPLIHGFCLKRGLQDADAADVTQDAMTRVHRAIASLEYDPKLGSFRGWLFTIVRNKIRDFFDQQNRLVRATGATSVFNLLANTPADEQLEAEWDADFRRQLYARAAKTVQGDVAAATWQAFHLTAVEGQTPAAVAIKLKITVAAVYLAKSRVMARLKAEMAILVDEKETPHP